MHGTNHLHKQIVGTTQLITAPYFLQAEILMFTLAIRIVQGEHHRKKKKKSDCCKDTA